MTPARVGRITQLKRLWQILRVLKHHHVLHLLFDLNPQQHWGARLAKRCFVRRRDWDAPTQARNLRTALESLGPIFIKLGQVLSTRPDLLPADYIHELSHLQDRVTPVAQADIERILTAELGGASTEFFSAFEWQHVATASIAQVHRATVRNGRWAGREVAVKVLRPDVQALIEVDVACMYTAARLFARHHTDGTRLRPVEVVAQLERHLRDELDLQCEAANASQLRHNMTVMRESKLFVPEVCWDLTRRRVLVMEWMHGVPAANIATLNQRGFDLNRLSKDGVEIFFTQVFRDGFFHADMHPGNVFIGTQGAAHGHYIALDCGIVGSLSSIDRHYLAVNLLAFFNRDYRGVARAHIESGWVPKNTDEAALTSVVRTVCEPYFGRPISEISLGQVLLRLFDVSRTFNVEVQPQLVLLQKTLLNVEGMGRVMNPQLDLWATAKPFLERWMREVLGPRGLWRQLKQEWPMIAHHAPIAPRQLLQTLNQLSTLSQTAGHSPAMTAYAARVRRQLRLLYGLVAVSLITCATMAIALFLR